MALSDHMQRDHHLQHNEGHIDAQQQSALPAEKLLEENDWNIRKAVEE